MEHRMPVTRMGHECAAYGRKGRETRIRDAEIDCSSHQTLSPEPQDPLPCFPIIIFYWLS